MVRTRSIVIFIVIVIITLVRSKPDANNLAYTGASLGLHTDLPYYRYTPGVQFLHCISQAQGPGGDNVFSDGFSVAEKMRADFPSEFELLRISSGDRRIFLPIDILGVIPFSDNKFISDLPGHTGLASPLGRLISLLRKIVKI